MLPVFYARIRLTAMMHSDAATHVPYVWSCPTSLQGLRVPQQCDGGMFPCTSLWSGNVHFVGACRPILGGVRGGCREETEQFHHCDPEGRAMHRVRSNRVACIEMCKPLFRLGAVSCAYCRGEMRRDLQKKTCFFPLFWAPQTETIFRAHK